MLYKLKFFVKSIVIKILMGTRNGASLEHKNGSMAFNQTLYQQYNFLGVDYALNSISKYLRGPPVW